MTLTNAHQLIKNNQLEPDVKTKTEQNQMKMRSYISIYLSTYLSIYLSIYLSTYLSIYLSIYLSMSELLL